MISVMFLQKIFMKFHCSVGFLSLSIMYLIVYISPVTVNSIMRVLRKNSIAVFRTYLIILPLLVV